MLGEESAACYRPQHGTAAGIGATRRRGWSSGSGRDGDGIRTGLEDNIRLDRTLQSANNAQLVSLACQVAQPAWLPSCHASRGTAETQPGDCGADHRQEARSSPSIGYPTESLQGADDLQPPGSRRTASMPSSPRPGVKAEDFPALFPALFRITTLHGALITMPHKVSVTDDGRRTDHRSRIAGAMQRGIEAAGLVAAGRYVRRRRLRSRRDPEGLRPSRSRGARSSGRAASVRPLAIAGRERGCARSGCST